LVNGKVGNTTKRGASGIGRPPTLKKQVELVGLERNWQKPMEGPESRTAGGEEGKVRRDVCHCAFKPSAASG